MIDVFCVYWGDKYDKAYIYALEEAVRQNLSVEYTFKCITTQNIPGINTVLPTVSYSGWWQKIGLFSPLTSFGPSLYFDLDVVITGSLDYLVPYTENDLSAPANWGQSGHGGIQSSVLAWNGQYRDPYRKFKWGVDNERLHGDQCFLTELRGKDYTRLPGICSYKYHCRQDVPNGISVVCFHGKPDPHEVSDPWISKYTSTLRSRINGTTANGLSQGLRATA